MSEQSTPARPFFKPLPEHDTLQTAYLLWKLSEKVVVQPNGCWFWTGAKSRDGYGHFSIGGRGHNQTKCVHRTVYQLCVGATPRWLYVCHDCPGGDNPVCCNPAHLWLGSHRQNVGDMMAKGRHRTNPNRGEKNHAARFTDDEVREIRRRVAQGGAGLLGQIAREKGVAKDIVWRLVRRLTYSSVPD